MSIGAISSVNPFLNNSINSVYGASVNATKSVSIFGGQNNNNKSQAIDLYNIDINNVGTVNPFQAVNTSAKVYGVAPASANENYRNGLAPSDNLQNVWQMPKSVVQW